MRSSRGVTFIELVVVVGLFGILFGVMAGIMYNSDTFFTKGQDRIAEQFEARKIVDILSRDLRASAPDWIANSTHYPLSISENFTRLDYYIPLFNANGEVSGLRKITYKRDPLDQGRLLVKEGTSPETAVTGALEDIRFGAGCAGCASYDCATPADDCPVIRIQASTKKAAQFDLVTKIFLRNRISTMANETSVEAPGEGEF